MTWHLHDSTWLPRLHPRTIHGLSSVILIPCGPIPCLTAADKNSWPGEKGGATTTPPLNPKPQVAYICRVDGDRLSHTRGHHARRSFSPPTYSWRWCAAHEANGFEFARRKGGLCHPLAYAIWWEFWDLGSIHSPSLALVVVLIAWWWWWLLGYPTLHRHQASSIPICDATRKVPQAGWHRILGPAFALRWLKSDVQLCVSSLRVGNNGAIGFRDFVEFLSRLFPPRLDRCENGRKETTAPIVIDVMHNHNAYGMNAPFAFCFVGCSPLKMRRIISRPYLVCGTAGNRYSPPLSLLLHAWEWVHICRNIRRESFYWCAYGLSNFSYP